MLASDIQEYQRNSYYSNTSKISDASGAVFFDIFSMAADDATEQPAEDSESADSLRSARSTFSVEVYTQDQGNIAFTIEKAGEGADSYFDTAENVYQSLLEQYTTLTESGFTSATLSEDDLRQMADIFAKISAFEHQDGTEAFYGENNAARYTLSSGAVVDMSHQEIVSADAAYSTSALPQEWSEANPISKLPGFSDFLGFSYEEVEDISADSDIEESSDTEETDDTNTGETVEDDDNSSEEETSIYTPPSDSLNKALFLLIEENTDGIAYESEAESNLRSCINGFYSEMTDSSTLLEKMERLDEVMPFIAQATMLLDEPATVYNVCKSIDSAFDKAFLNADYSVKEGPDSEFTERARAMRGAIDQHIKALKKLCDELSEYSQEHPLDPFATEEDVDPVWESMIEQFNSKTASFFENLGVTESTTEDFLAQFISSDAEETDSNTAVDDEDDTSESYGPESGIAGKIFTVINANDEGIATASAAETELLDIAGEFKSQLLQMKYAKSDVEAMKTFFDNSLPYFEKATSMLDSHDAVQDIADTLNSAFGSCFLNSDRSIVTGIDPELQTELRTIRGAFDSAYAKITAKTKEMTTYSSSKTQAQLKSDSAWQQLTKDLKQLQEGLFNSLNTQDYETVISEYY